MADIADINTYLSQQASLALYPGGAPAPGTISPVAGMEVYIFEGWPIPEVLDLDLTGRMLDASGAVVSRANGPRAQVSVYPMRGTNEKIYQILDETYIIFPPVYGLTLSPISMQAGSPPVSSNFQVTITGTPAATEFLTVEIDQFYIASAGGSTVAAILNSLATQINGFSPVHGGGFAQYVATVSGNTLTVAGAAYCFARLGVQGTLGKVTHRERQDIMISVWCPDHGSRTIIAKAIDVLIKHNLVVTMPDTSKALIIYNRTNWYDENEPVACYRRDLIYCADYATVEQFPGTVITSVSTSITPNDPTTQNFIGATSVT